jgi:hypothetical protein
MNVAMRIVGLTVGCGLLSACIDAGSVADEQTVAINASWFHRSAWSPPISLGPVVNSLANDESPVLSPNGLVLYFSSRRVAANGTDIYVTRREDVHAPWQPPEIVGALNTAFNDAVSSLSEDGHYIFFGSNRPGGAGAADIYYAYRADVCDDRGWEAPVALASVNSTLADGGPFFRHKADARGNLYFNRGPTPQVSDFFVAEIELPSGRLISGPVAVEELNSELSENTLRVYGPRKEAFFSRNAGGNADLYVATRIHWKDAWSAPQVVSELTTGINEYQPTLTRNGRIMIFSHGPSLNEMDLYMTTRGVDDDVEGAGGCGGFSDDTRADP